MSKRPEGVQLNPSYLYITNDTSQGHPAVLVPTIGGGWKRYTLDSAHHIEGQDVKLSQSQISSIEARATKVYKFYKPAVATFEAKLDKYSHHTELTPEQWEREIKAIVHAPEVPGARLSPIERAGSPKPPETGSSPKPQPSQAPRLKPPSGRDSSRKPATAHGRETHSNALRQA